VFSVVVVSKTQRTLNDRSTFVSQASGNSSRKYCVPCGICPYIVDEFSSEVYGLGVSCLYKKILKILNTIQQTLLLHCVQKKNRIWRVNTRYYLHYF